MNLVPIELVYEEHHELLYRQKRLTKIINEYLEANPDSRITGWETNILLAPNDQYVLQIILQEEQRTEIQKTRNRRI